MQRLQIQIHILGHFTVQYTILPLSNLWGEKSQQYFPEEPSARREKKNKGNMI